MDDFDIDLMCGTADDPCCGNCSFFTRLDVPIPIQGSRHTRDGKCGFKRIERGAEYRCTSDWCDRHPNGAPSRLRQG